MLVDILGSEIGTQPGPFDGSLEYNEDWGIKGSLLQDSLGYTGGIELGFNEGS